MSYETLRKELSTHLINNFTGVDLSRVVHGRTRGGLNTLTNGVSTPWCRFVFTVNFSQNAEIGDGFQIADGEVILQVFTSTKVGEKTAMQIVDDFETAFQNQNFNGIHCFAVYPRILGVVGESFQINAQCRYEYQNFS